MAHLIWEAFSEDVGNFVEMFAGSAAVLLARPPVTNPDEPHHETLNDVDGFIVNCLRAIKRDILKTHRDKRVTPLADASAGIQNEAAAILIFVAFAIAVGSLALSRRVVPPKREQKMAVALN